MKLERREWITIGAGCALVAAVFVYKIAGNLSESSAGAVIADKTEQLGQFIALRQRTVQAGKQIGIELPQVGSSYQEVLIRRELTTLAGKGGLQISSTRLNAARGRRETESQSMPFRLELAGQFASVIGFINDLEHSKIPFVIRDVQIESGASGGGQGGGQGGGGGSPEMGGGRGGRGGGGGQKQADGSVRVTMNIDSYVFPKVHVSEKAVKELEATMPTPAPQQSSSPQLIVQQPGMSRPPMPQGSPGMTSGPGTSGSRSRSMPARMRNMSPEMMEKMKARQQEIMRVMKEDPARGKQMIEEFQKEMGGGQ